MACRATRVGIGSKGCVTFSPVKNRRLRDVQGQPGTPRLADLAWLFNMNRGIFMTPGREEEWTLSVTHTDEAVDRYVAVLRRGLAREPDSLNRPRARDRHAGRRSPPPSPRRAMTRRSRCAARTS